MGLFSGITDALSDAVGSVGDLAGNALKGVATNPIGAAYSLATGNLTPLISSALGGIATQGMRTPQGTASYGNINQGLLGIGASQAQIEASRKAIQAAQQQAIQGGQTAANMAAFRPVGTTTRFGTSAYSIDPATGGIKADYSLSPLAAGYQQSLADMTNQGLMQGQQVQGLAGQYLGESPEAVRQRYVQQQNALLAPGQEQQLAGIRNRLFQTGRGGLATGATEAGGLAATNPEMAAYYNALANQQRQIAAGADQAAQQQIQFGQQLAGQAYSPFTAGFGAQGAVETAGQQPLTLAQDIAKLQAAAGGTQGQLYGQGAQRAAAYGILPELQTSNTANILGGLASPTSGVGNLFGNLSSNIYNGLNPFTGNAYDWTTGASVIPDSTFNGYGDVSDLAQYGVF
jgi:hypothetical protein